MLGALAAALAISLAGERPNILFIMADDHCMQAISCYGSQLAQTPGIDRLAHEGLKFTRASVTNAICGPSRAVILTGRHSHINGYATNEKSFDGAQETFPKLLQSAGYRTEIVGKWHLGSDPTGFDRWEILPAQGVYWDPDFIVDGVRGKRVGHVTDLTTAAAVARLAALAPAARAGQPFAMLVQHKAPHRSWLPCLRHYSLYRDKPLPEPPTLLDHGTARSPAAALQTMQIDRDLSWKDDLKVPAPERAGLAAEYEAENAALAEVLADLSPQEIARWKFQRYARDYLRTAQGVDDSVGTLLETLDRLGLASNTIVIYTSDQGWFLGEHGWFDKRWMYEESFRTPLLVRWPGHIAAGAQSAALVQNLDFAPTFLEAAGVAAPAGMQGRSMLGLLTADRLVGSSASDADAAFRDAVYYRFEESTGPHTVPRHEGVATATHKLIRYLDLKDGSGAPLLELYDLSSDPQETHNLASEAASQPLVQTMLARLEQVRSQYRAPTP